MPQAFSPILDIHTSANTYGLEQNCYYCTVAALNNMTVEQFFHISEIMQQDTATSEEILNLWHEAGINNVTYEEFENRNKFDMEVIHNMPAGHGLGLAFRRANNKGHMVVLAKDKNGVVKCIDYQQNPPRITNFPPEDNITKVYLFYKTP